MSIQTFRFRFLATQFKQAMSNITLAAAKPVAFAVAVLNLALASNATGVEISTPQLDTLNGIVTNYGQQKNAAAPPLVGDLNHDGWVDDEDFARLVPDIAPPGSSVRGPETGVRSTDINNDGVVDVSDLIEFSRDYGKSVNAAQAPLPGDFNLDAFVDGDDLRAMIGALSTSAGTQVPTRVTSDGYGLGELEGLVANWGQQKNAAAPPLSGDVDFDGWVNEADFTQMIGDLVLPAAPVRGPETGVRSTDINNDGVVDLIDLAEFSRDYGKSVNGAQAPLPGDFNLDAFVDGDDLRAMIGALSTSAGTQVPTRVTSDGYGLGELEGLVANWGQQKNAAAPPLAGDVDFDGWVNEADFAQMIGDLDLPAAPVRGPETGVRSTDINNDGVVDLIDLAEFSRDYGKSVNGAQAPLPGDFNLDAFVDGDDLGILMDAYQGSVIATSAAVPEPTSIVMLGTLALAALRRRVR